MRKFQWLIWAIVAVILLAGCSVQPMPRTTRPTVQTPAKKEETKDLQFPCVLPDGLVAEQLTSYSGPYEEDGSGAYVENVAALTVYNPTQQMLAFGAFAVEQAGQTLYFFVQQLPPESRCLLLAYDKKQHDSSEITACRELSIRWEYPDFSRQQLDYLCLGPEITVINRDSRVLPQVTVWYKSYDRTEDCYIGGIAYAVHLYDMQPGEYRTVRPEHYDASTGKIVGIELKT